MTVTVRPLFGAAAFGRARLAILLVLAGLTCEVFAEPPKFQVPIQCVVGEDCFIQNYFDHDTGPGWRDHACGPLSYDGHHGTDFRLKNLLQMEKGVAVVAAAAGTVERVRDGEPDISLRDREQPLARGREAGNAVRIDHGQGWVSQYNHLKKNSVQVRPGQRVETGTTLGLVGLSGKTEFPHVDLTIRKDGQPIDPFSPDGNAPCGKSASTLWAAEALPAVAYRATGLLNAGFSSRLPDRHFIQRGEHPEVTLDGNAAAIFFHVEVFGVRAGDIEELEVRSPTGRTLSRRTVTLDRDLAVRQAYLGKRRTQQSWEVGEYRGSYVLRRTDRIVLDVSRKVAVTAPY